MTPTPPLAPAAPFHRGIQARLIWLITLLSAGLVGTFLLVRHWEEGEAEEIVAEATLQQTVQLEHWLGRSRLSLINVARDFRGQPVLASIATDSATPPSAVTSELSQQLAQSGADYLWIAGAEGSIRLAVAHPHRQGAIPAPLSPEDLRALTTGAKPPRFFCELDGVLVEVCGEAILPGGTPAPNTPLPAPLGWALAGRRWDSAYTATLASLTEGEVILFAPHTVRTPSSRTDRVVVTYHLNDWQGRPLRQLFAQRDTPQAARYLRTDARQVRLFLAYGLLVLTGVGFALQFWVMRPLATIRASLAQQNPAPLAALRAERTELGALAGLVAESFARQEALRHEIEERTRTQNDLQKSQDELRRTIDERARLGRDLHDGVIQSLFAAGMSLTGVGAQLQPNQGDAAARLEKTRHALNETIRDIRNFIAGLEPESLREQSFAEAVNLLLRFMQSVRPYQPTMEVDPAVAARLTLAQRLHALQIAREAVSNALRHGEADHVTISLRAVEKTIEFEVRDDGHGFVPGAVPAGAGGGHGLMNFQRRARELGAELVLSSEPGRGTSVRLIFYPPL